MQDFNARYEIESMLIKIIERGERVVMEWLGKERVV